MSMPSLAKRVRTLKPSVTVAFMNRAKAMQRQGLDVLSFAAGEPDFDTPVQVKEAAKKALDAGQTKYMPTFGDPDTRAAVAEKCIKDNGIPTTPEHVAISAGGKHALFVAIHCLFDNVAPGEAQQECLLPVPAWVSYAPIVELAGGKIVELPTGPETDFKVTPEQIRKAITPRTRLFIMNSPSNPCGTMYTPEELKAIAKVLAEAASTVAPELVVLSDELYEKIIYGGIPHYSIGASPEIAERTITLNGLSKAYAMTGWRIGYAVTSGAFGKALIDAMATLQGQMSTNITSFTYPAIREALRNTKDDVERMRQAFGRRAATVVQRMEKIPQLKYSKPTGAYYIFPDISWCFGKTTKGGRRINSAMDFCEAALEEAHIAFVPGEDFGGSGGRHIRISFACSEEQINKGMDRLEAFLAAMR